MNVRGNEQADTLAKEGTKGKRLPRDEITSITYLKRKVKEQQMTTWNARWPTMKRGHSYHGRPANNIHPLLRNHPSRKLVSTVIQMRTGHGGDRQYLARIPTSSIESQICPCGYRRQSSGHLLLDCKYYKPERRRMKQKIKPLPLTWHMAMHTGKGFQAVLKFLERTGVGSWTWIL